MLSKKIGYKLGKIKSNIVAYVDDIVLLPSSAYALRLLLDKAYEEASQLHLEVNLEKTKLMKFHFSTRNLHHIPSIA